MSDFSDGEEQIKIGQDVNKYDKKVDLEKRVNALRKKYGGSAVRKGITLRDKGFTASESVHEGGITKGVDYKKE